MKIRCRTIEAAELPQRYLDQGFSYTKQLNLAEGAAYTVYGMCIWRGCLMFLIDPSDEGVPSWYPAPAFDVINDHIPKTWSFSYSREEEDCGMAAIFGYKELVNSQEHYNGLAELLPKDLELFKKRKKEINLQESV